MHSILLSQAINNLAALQVNPYPGRGLIIGVNASGSSLVQIYWIMGRREDSRNRVFVVGENGLVETAPADPAKMKNPSLIIYKAMMEKDGFYIVSNGDQTETVAEKYRDISLHTALLSRTYEPDPPHSTSRITATCGLVKQPGFEIVLLRKSSFDNSCDRHLYRWETIAPGVGYCITTYSGDGNPLPPFRGEPYVMPIAENIDDVANGIWDALNVDNRVSLAVKFIALEKGVPVSRVKIINKYKQVGA